MVFKKKNKCGKIGKANLKHGGRCASSKGIERLRNGWKPKTIICSNITISDEEENFVSEFYSKVHEENDTFADDFQIELAAGQILQIHRQFRFAAEKRIGKDVSRMIGTLLSTLRELNATKNSRKENKININVQSDIMSLIQENYGSNENTGEKEKGKKGVDEKKI